MQTGLQRAGGLAPLLTLKLAEAAHLAGQGLTPEVVVCPPALHTATELIVRCTALLVPGARLYDCCSGQGAQEPFWQHAYSVAVR